MREMLPTKVILGFTIVVVLASTLISSVGAFPSGPPGTLRWCRTSNPSTGWGGYDGAYDVALDSTGIYVVGYDCCPGPYMSEWRIEKRSRTTGNLIWNRSDDLPGTDYASGVAVYKTTVYIVGFQGLYEDPDPDVSWAIQTRNATTGARIWYGIYNPTPHNDRAVDVAVNAGVMYVVGDVELSVDTPSSRLMKLTPLGPIYVRTFIDVPGHVRAVAADNTGVYLVGADDISGDAVWRIEKRSLTTLDLIWAVTPDYSDDREWATDVALDSTGVYVVGWDSQFGYPNTQWRIQKRNKTNGQLIAEWTYNPSAGLDEALGVAVAGKNVFAAGYDSIHGSDQEWRIISLNKKTLGLRWSAAVNPSPSPDVPGDKAQRVAADSTGAYIVGYDWGSPDGSMEWRIQKNNP